MILPDPSTVPGTILGTTAYMAPEQARQKPVDRRVDIWALGCVMFEMLTAQPAFTGDTPSDVLVNIIEHEPNWEALPASTPPTIRRLLHRCLEKSARHRLDSAAVVRLEIDEAERDPASVPSTGRPGASQVSLWPALAWAAFGALGLLTVIVADTFTAIRSSRVAGGLIFHHRRAQPDPAGRPLRRGANGPQRDFFWQLRQQEPALSA